MIRYRAKKWWSLKESPDGQYVAYHEHEEEVNRLKSDNAKLWERINQLVEEHKQEVQNSDEWMRLYWAECREVQNQRACILILMIVIVSGLTFAMLKAFVWV